MSSDYQQDDDTTPIPSFKPRIANESYARQKATELGLDPNRFAAQLRTESGFSSRAFNKGTKAQGIGQYIPGTARQRGLDPSDAKASIDQAAADKRKFVDQFGNERAAESAHFNGPGNAVAALRNKSGNPKTAAYVGGIDKATRQTQDDAEDNTPIPSFKMDSATPVAGRPLSMGQSSAPRRIAQPRKWETTAPADDRRPTTVPGVINLQAPAGQQFNIPRGGFQHTPAQDIANAIASERTFTPKPKTAPTAPRISQKPAGLEMSLEDLQSAPDPRATPQNPNERIADPNKWKTIVAEGKATEARNKDQVNYLSSLPPGERRAKAVEIARREPLGDEARKLAGFGLAERVFQATAGPLLGTFGETISGLGEKAEQVAPYIGYDDYHSPLKRIGGDINAATSHLRNMAPHDAASEFAGGLAGTVPLLALPGHLAGMAVQSYLGSIGRGEDEGTALKHAAVMVGGLTGGGIVGQKLEQQVHGTIARYLARTTGATTGLEAMSIGTGEAQTPDAIGQRIGMGAVFGIHGGGERPQERISKQQQATTDAATRATEGATQQIGQLQDLARRNIARADAAERAHVMPGAPERGADQSLRQHYEAQNHAKLAEQDQARAAQRQQATDYQQQRVAEEQGRVPAQTPEELAQRQHTPGPAYGLAEREAYQQQRAAQEQAQPEGNLPELPKLVKKSQVTPEGTGAPSGVVGKAVNETSSAAALPEPLKTEVGTPASRDVLPGEPGSEPGVYGVTPIVSNPPAGSETAGPQPNARGAFADEPRRSDTQPDRERSITQTTSEVAEKPKDDRLSPTIPASPEERAAQIDAAERGRLFVERSNAEHRQQQAQKPERQQGIDPETAQAFREMNPPRSEARTQFLEDAKATRIPPEMAEQLREIGYDPDELKLSVDEAKEILADDAARFKDAEIEAEGMAEDARKKFLEDEHAKTAEYRDRGPETVDRQPSSVEVPNLGIDSQADQVKIAEGFTDEKFRSALEAVTSPDKEPTQKDIARFRTQAKRIGISGESIRSILVSRTTGRAKTSVGRSPGGETVSTSRAKPSGEAGKESVQESTAGKSVEAVKPTVQPRISKAEAAVKAEPQIAAMKTPKAKPKGKPKPSSIDSETLDLVSYIHNRGGINMGSLKGEQRQLRESRLRRPGFFNKKGMAWDDMETELRSEGYLQEGESLIDALDAAARGEKRYANSSAYNEQIDQENALYSVGLTGKVNLDDARLILTKAKGNKQWTDLVYKVLDHESEPSEKDLRRFRSLSGKLGLSDETIEAIVRSGVRSGEGGRAPGDVAFASGEEIADRAPAREPAAPRGRSEEPAASEQSRTLEPEATLHSTGLADLVEGKDADTIANKALKDPDWRTAFSKVFHEQTEPSKSDIDAFREASKRLHISPEAVGDILEAGKHGRSEDAVDFSFGDQPEDAGTPSDSASVHTKPKDAEFRNVKPGDPRLTTTQIDRVREIESRLHEKGETVDKFLKQRGLSAGDELTPPEADLLREMADNRKSRRAPDKSEQGSMFDSTPTVESRAEDQAREPKPGINFGLFAGTAEEAAKPAEAKPTAEQSQAEILNTPLGHAIQLIKGGATPGDVIEVLKTKYKSGPMQAENLERRARQSLEPKIVTPQVPTRAATADATKKIEDFGEKIGGARKDTATSTGERGSKPKESEDPGWRKRFSVSEITTSTKEGEAGKFAIYDTKKTDWRGQPRQLGQLFDSKEAAQKGVELAAVAQKHRVQMSRPDADGNSTYSIWREVTDRKRLQVVKEEFKTRDEAMKYMADHAVDIIETKTNFGEEILVKPEKVVRKGSERRTGPATKEMFGEAFGFRGVEFGNWNNQAERQEVMNHAFDGLHDLAEMLDVPARALSLNGDLALAFGARGQGLSGAKAHYERGHAVINLTKMSGAGSLAHEWFHALDHYLGRLDSKAASEKVKNASGDMVFPTKSRDADYASHGFSARNSKAREELRTSYKELIQTMFTKAEKFVEDTQKAEKFVGGSRDMLASKLNEIRDSQYSGLSKQLDTRYRSRHTKPATSEQLAEFDRLAAKLIAGEDLKTEYLATSKPGIPAGARGGMTGRRTNETLEAMNVILKAVRGRSGFNSEHTGVLDNVRTNLSHYQQRIDMLKSASEGETKTKNVPTSYAMGAKRIDQGRASDYWTTEHEMAARAFSAYVEDKAASTENRSDFLSYGSDNKFYRMLGLEPYPEGAEREAINGAFDHFFMKAREHELRADLKDQISVETRKLLNQTNTGIPTELIGLYSKLGASYVREGVADLTEFVKRLKSDLGDVRYKVMLDHVGGIPALWRESNREVSSQSSVLSRSTVPGTQSEARYDGRPKSSAAPDPSMPKIVGRKPVAEAVGAEQGNSAREQQAAEPPAQSKAPTAPTPEAKVEKIPTPVETAPVAEHAKVEEPEHHSNFQPRETTGTFKEGAPEFPATDARTPEAKEDAKAVSILEGKGTRERALPLTLDAAELESGTNRTYKPTSIILGSETGRATVKEKGVDGAIEHVLHGDAGIEWASTGYAAMEHLRAEEAKLRATDPAGADEIAAKRLKFVGDFTEQATKRGQAIAGIRAIEEFAPDRAVYEANRLSQGKRKRGLNAVEEARISKIGTDLQVAQDRIKTLEATLEAQAATKTRSKKEAKKADYQKRLEDQGATAKQALAGRMTNFDFGDLHRPGERGAVTIGEPPLPGDAELIAQYAASQLANLNTAADLNAHLTKEFGAAVEPILSNIRRRALAIREEARLAEIKDAPPERRRTIIQDIEKEIAALNQLSKDAAQQATEAARQTAKDVAAGRRQARRADIGQADTAARVRRIQEGIARDSEKESLRERATQARRELTNASKAERAAYREDIRTGREAARKAAIWDSPLRAAATEARTRLATVDGRRSPVDDLVHVATEMLLPKKPGSSPSKFYVDLKAAFPDLVTRKNQGEIYKRAYQRVEDMKTASREAARMRSASAEGSRLWNEMGIDTDAKALLIQRAEAQRQQLEARSKMAGEFNRVSRSRLGRIGFEIQSLPRALQSSIDAPLGRQNLFYLVTHPIETARFTVPATAKGYMALKRSDFHQLVADQQKHPDYKLALRSKLDLPGIASEVDPRTSAEESFQSTVAERLTHVRLSEQAFTHGMNEARLQAFSRYADLGRAQGYTFESHPEFFNQAANFVNAATGRGNINETMKRATVFTNALFYSTRLQISRVQLLNNLLSPRKYLKTYDPVMRKVAAGEAIRLAAGMALIFGTAKLAGAKVTSDPEDPDFGKAVWGKVHYDLTAGEGALIRTVYRFLKATGKRLHGETPERGQDIPKIVSDFLRKKAAPWPGTIWNLAAGKDVVGHPANLKFTNPEHKSTGRYIQDLQDQNQLIRMVAPMIAGDFIDAANEEGWAGVGKIAPALGGIGTSVYDPNQKRISSGSRTASPYGKQTYGGTSGGYGTPSRGGAGGY